VRIILARGTSAGRQLARYRNALYRNALARGLSHNHALSAVVDQLQ
jgi:hypothetical protein